MMIYDLGKVLVLGVVVGWLFSKVKLPSLLGMLIVGMMIGPYGFGLLNGALLDISAELRQVALIVILTRAGLGMDVQKIKKLGLAALLMCFLPAVFEIVAVTILSSLLFHFSIIDGMILGSILSAVSPAIIVPRMLHLKEQPNINQDIVQLVLTGASLDDVFVLVVFSSLVSIRLTGQFDVSQLSVVPISIMTGIVIGALFGKLLSIVSKVGALKVQTMIVLLFGMSLFLLGVEKQLPFAFSAMVAIIVQSLVLVMQSPHLQSPLDKAYQTFWQGAEVWLFVLVGCLLDFRLILTYGLLAAALVLGALLIRMVGVFVSLMPTSFTPKHKIYTMMSYIPKATVQAAIGAIPLSLGFQTGQLMLVLSVLAILISAPLGAWIMDHFSYLAINKEV